MLSQQVWVSESHEPDPSPVQLRLLGSPERPKEGTDTGILGPNFSVSLFAHTLHTQRGWSGGRLLGHLGKVSPMAALAEGRVSCWALGPKWPPGSVLSREITQRQPSPGRDARPAKQDGTWRAALPSHGPREAGAHSQPWDWGGMSRSCQLSDILPSWGAPGLPQGYTYSLIAKSSLEPKSPVPPPPDAAPPPANHKSQSPLLRPRVKLFV